LWRQTQTGGTLPSAKEIVAKYDEALGGEAAPAAYV
jgi:hypothetical protein